VEPSFIPELIDRMCRVPDAASIAAAHLLSELIGRRVGGSTGTNLVGAVQLLHELEVRGEPGTVATLICDSGHRYAHSYYNPEWLRREGLDVERWRTLLEDYLLRGRWSDALAVQLLERGGR
jgi:cysteine synthase A